MKQQKTKSNASWQGLSVQQRKILDGWLFDEHLSYADALKRAKEELGFNGSQSSLARYFKQAAGERTVAEFTNAAALAEAVDGTAVSTERLRDSGLKIAARVFLQMVSETPHLIKEWTPLAKLLVQSEENQIRRETKQTENELRRETLQFARVRFQYNAISSAMRILPKLNQLAEDEREANMTVYDRNKRLNDVRRSLFGDDIPELLPENEEEAAHPEIIQQRYEEAQERRAKEWEKEYEVIQQRNAELSRKYQAELRAQAKAAAKAKDDDWKYNDDEDSEEFKEAPRQEDPEEARRQAEARREEFAQYRKNMNDPKILAEERAAREAEEREEERQRALEEAGGEPVAAPEPPKTRKPAAKKKEKQETPETPEAPVVLVDEPKKLTPEERAREIEELMKRARMQAEYESRRGR